MSTAAVALSCLAPACSPGLSGLKAVSHDAGNADSGGSGGTAGGGGMAGGGAAGSAGATDASTAGSGGTAGTDAGSDAGDAGTFTCTPKGSVFDVLTSSDLGGAPIASSSLLAVDAVSSGFNPTAYVVVATGSGSATTTSIVVRTVTDTLVPMGTTVTFDTSQPAHIVSGYATSAGLHVLGWRGMDLVDWTFPVGLTGNLVQGTATVLKTGVCSSGIAGACFMGEGAALHEVVTCNVQANGTGAYALSVDGQIIDNGASTNLIVHDCLAVGPTYVIETGDLTSPQLHYGQTMSQLAAAHPFAFTTSVTQASFLGPLAATPSNDGVVLVAAKLANVVSFVPIDVYTGTLPITKVADLGQVPVPELSKQLTVNKLDAFYGLSHPDVGQKLIQYAGFAVSGTNVALTAVGTGGKLLAYGVPVYTVPAGQSSVTQAAVGVMGPTTLVAWDEHDSQANTDVVRGEMMLCSVQ